MNFLWGNDYILHESIAFILKRKAQKSLIRGSLYRLFCSSKFSWISTIFYQRKLELLQNIIINIMEGSIIVYKNFNRIFLSIWNYSIKIFTFKATGEKFTQFKRREENNCDKSKKVINKYTVCFNACR